MNSGLNIISMSRYILVDWPQSQEFMEDDRCLQCIEIEGAMFVPEDVYDYYINSNIDAI